MYWIQKKQVVFSLLFKAKTDAKLSDLMRLSSKYMNAQAYTKDERLFDVQLQFNEQSTEPENFKLYQNSPNPFNKQTTIAFELAKATEATLKVQDLTGRVIREIKAVFEKDTMK